MTSHSGAAIFARRDLQPVEVTNDLLQWRNKFATRFDPEVPLSC